MGVWRNGRTAALTMATAAWLCGTAAAQGLGGAGTVQGTVKDPTGGVMVAVTVDLSNPVSGLKRETTTDPTGHFVFRNLPPNPYQIQVAAQGFQTLQRTVDVRTAVPVEVDLTLAVGNTTSVEVVGHANDLVELDPTTHTDVDQLFVEKLPIESSGGLNQVVMMASPGVAADSNGFFHPMGDHAQTQFSIDNQPVTDQQSRLYSNQISPDAVQSMEVITGVPPAEFGDKDSLVVRIVTKSGLDQPKPTGSVTVGYGSFKNPTGEVNLGAGTHTFGNFLSASGMQTDRFLDPPEFTAIHDNGHNESLFDRVDFHANATDSYHLNVQGAQSAFDVPDTYDESAAGQAQHQTITTFNVAPGYTRILSQDWLLSADGFVRQDHVTYTPSVNPLADDTGTVAQNRKLTNYGGKTDLAYVHGAHNVKIGASAGATQLNEHWTLGVTDPTANSPCKSTLNVENEDFDIPSADTSLTSTSQCAAAGLEVNDGFIPGLLPYDLTRGGGLYTFDGSKTITQEALYAQDEIQGHNLTLKLGARLDNYDGFASRTMLQPRVGLSYSAPKTNTVLRISYGRTMETPYNENLVLSSTADPNIFGASGVPLRPGQRDQVDGGIQQALGRWLVADFDYFYKHTTGAYDFGQLFATPIFFPVQWDHSQLYGFTGRINLVEHNGFTASMTMGHANALFFPPGVGGLLTDVPPGEFRIDHDQKFEQTTNVQYTFLKSIGAWGSVSWQYESGLVAGAATDQATVLATLTGDQQAQLGLTCAGVPATVSAPITSCSPANFATSRVVVPLSGAEDDVNNPPRVAARNLFDLGLGVNNLFKGQHTKVRLRVAVVNLTNKDTLYNFLSTFSGTHFVTPRAYQAQIGVTF